MKKQDIAANILGSTEVQERLLINRQRLAVLVAEGKLKPFKQLAKEKLFWLSDVEQLAKEFSLDPRTNLFKKGDLKNVQ
jgi:hypothetical protein